MRSTSAKRKANARAKRKKQRIGWRKKMNSFEVGDHVVTITGHAGVVESFATIISKNGFGTQRRYYHVRILDRPSGQIHGEFESQDGKHMTRLPSLDDELGEDYLA